METGNILRIAGIVVVCIAVISAISYSITKYLLKVALDREIPRIIGNREKAKQRLTGYTDVETWVKAAADAAQKLENSGCETVEIVCHDGKKLTGHWHASDNAERTIIAMHGWRSSWANDFGMIADFWHDNRCNVLYAEQRGQNNSGGDYMGFGLLERYDCLDWINWVNERCGTDTPLYLAGVSMGATTVLMTAGFELPHNIRGVIADCGFTSPNAIWKHVTENNLHLNYGLRAAAVNDLCRKKIQVGANDYSSVEAMKMSSVPVLFVHGTDDAFVPIEMTYENYKACAAPKRLLVVPGADHGMSYCVEREKYEAAVKEFWKDFDKAAYCRMGKADEEKHFTGL